MAEIPVERKSGLPWWVWLLGLLALLLLLSSLLRSCNNGVAVVNNNDNTNTVTRTTTTTTSTNANSNAGSVLNGNTTVTRGDALTDISSFLSSSNRASFIGRGAQLNNVRVQRVLSDRAFTVGPSNGQEMYVVLDNSLNEGGSERKFRIEEGQMLTLAGTMEKPPTAEINAEQRKPGDIKLNPAEASEMKRQQVYLHANKIQNGAVVEGSK